MKRWAVLLTDESNEDAEDLVLYQESQEQAEDLGKCLAPFTRAEVTVALIAADDDEDDAADESSVKTLN